MTRTSLIAVAVAVTLSGLTAMPVLAQNHVRKVAPSHLSHYWTLTNTYVDANAPNSGHGLNAIGCAAVSYVVGADGKTRHVKVAKVVPSTSDFRVTAKSFVQALHYAPTAANPHDIPVATYFIVPFNIPHGAKATLERVLKSCHLPGYGG